jgi:hypothetical protein
VLGRFGTVTRILTISSDHPLASWLLSRFVSHDLLLVSVRPLPGPAETPPPRPGRGQVFSRSNSTCRPFHPIRVACSRPSPPVVCPPRCSDRRPITDGDTSMDPSPARRGCGACVPLDGAPPGGSASLTGRPITGVVHRCLGRAVDARRPRGSHARRWAQRSRSTCLAPDGRRWRAVTAVRRRGIWHSLESRPARAYAQLLAWHDLFWAAVGVVGRKAGLGHAVPAAICSRVCGCRCPSLSPLFHRRIAPPAVSGRTSRLIE